MQFNNNAAASAPESEAKLVLEKYDITGIFAQKLYLLKGFKVVLICDDSTSVGSHFAFDIY
jgi:hypothetical protein